MKLRGGRKRRVGPRETGRGWVKAGWMDSRGAERKGKEGGVKAGGRGGRRYSRRYFGKYSKGTLEGQD